MNRLEKESAKINDVLASWPQLALDIEKAVILKTEREHRLVLDKYATAKALSEELELLHCELGSQAYPTSQEIANVKAAQRKITTLENKLCGMNLSVAIKMLGGNTITVTSLRTGETLNIKDDLLSINEAVKITIPDVMQMNLSPADINVDETEAAIAQQKKIVHDIFECYKSNSIEALEQLTLKVAEIKKKIEIKSNLLTMMLGETSYKELESAALSITGTVRSKTEIDLEISAVCGTGNIAKYITTKETIEASYAAEYGSLNELKAKAYDIQSELKKAQDSIAMVQDIPAQYLSITDPERHLAMLQNQMKAKKQNREDALTAKTRAVRTVETYKETLSGDPAHNAEMAKRLFEEKKSLLDHWVHISDVLEAQKQDIQSNPMHDISESFSNYLGIISDGKISSEFPNQEKLNMIIYSDDSLLDYEKLSEGTKETVSLAFRLAVLDHLFPEGGGVIVFDDPFTDMDADRTERSCALIQKCAVKHQVIFLTCGGL